MVVIRSQCHLCRLLVRPAFFLSSLAVDAANFARYIRSHWEIENALYWSLDVVFAEDRSRIRSEQGARHLI
ncbi:transposase [Oxynema sp. CENA135]|nr:transposase [Oxynema sp. CENA135]